MPGADNPVILVTRIINSCQAVSGYSLPCGQIDDWQGEGMCAFCPREGG